jgi:hypothetical protein
LKVGRRYLAPRKVAGEIFLKDADEITPVLAQPEKPVPNGTRVTRFDQPCSAACHRHACVETAERDRAVLQFRAA